MTNEIKVTVLAGELAWYKETCAIEDYVDNISKYVPAACRLARIGVTEQELEKIVAAEASDARIDIPKEVEHFDTEWLPYAATIAYAVQMANLDSEVLPDEDRKKINDIFMSYNGLIGQDLELVTADVELSGKEGAFVADYIATRVQTAFEGYVFNFFSKYKESCDWKAAVEGALVDVAGEDFVEHVPAILEFQKKYATVDTTMATFIDWIATEGANELLGNRYAGNETLRRRLMCVVEVLIQMAQDYDNC